MNIFFITTYDLLSQNISQRRKFYEAIREFYNRIKSLAVKCEFNTELNNILRDKYISDMKTGAVFYVQKKMILN